jgi:ribosomal protein S30
MHGAIVKAVKVREAEPDLPVVEAAERAGCC